MNAIVKYSGVQFGSYTWMSESNTVLMTVSWHKSESFSHKTHKDWFKVDSKEFWSFSQNCKGQVRHIRVYLCTLLHSLYCQFFSHLHFFMLYFGLYLVRTNLWWLLYFLHFHTVSIADGVLFILHVVTLKWLHLPTCLHRQSEQCIGCH